MSIKENPRRAVIFSVCTNHCLGRLRLKVLFHLDHYTVLEAPARSTSHACYSTPLGAGDAFDFIL